MKNSNNRTITNHFYELISFHKSRQGVNGLHIFHIIKPSKWPVLMSIVLFALALSFVLWINLNTKISFGIYNMYFAAFVFLNIFYFWCYDLMNESGEHNKRIKSGLKIGMVLFIMSEFMFFFAFFWAYLHSSTNPSIEIGHSWPPLGQESLLINSISLPFLNTLLLLTSGVCVTLAHKFSTIFFILEESLINLKFDRIFQTFKFIRTNYKFGSELLISNIYKFNYNRHILRISIVCSLFLTIILALVFTNIQYNEYIEASFNLSDGIYASCFYLMTGFHGVHVIVGSVFLISCYLQLQKSQNFYKDMTGLDCAIWYWHFVDIVWLFLYVLVYLIADDAFHREAKISLYKRLAIHDSIFNNFYHGCESLGFAIKDQKYFNMPGSTTMSEILWLHDFILYFIIIIFFIVVSLFYGILKDYTTLFLSDSYSKFLSEKGATPFGCNGTGVLLTQFIVSQCPGARCPTDPAHSVSVSQCLSVSY